VKKIINCTILRKNGSFELGTIQVRDGVIFSEKEPFANDPDVLDFSAFTIVPGFIDLHVHGGGGADFMNGDEESVRTVLRAHASRGTTGLLATTLTSSQESIDKAIIAIKRVTKNPKRGESQILGIHLEGPYICAARKGAQPLKYVRNPSFSELEHWVELSEGAIKQITLAPEIPGALDFIKAARKLGIVCSLGHTDATFEQTQAAIDAGATQATHLFNAMTGLHHRAPGTAGAVLASDTVVAELICDGIHLHPGAIEVAVRCKSADRCALITDAMEAAIMPDGIYQLGGQEVISKNGVASFPDGTLAGSVLTMDKAVHNVQKYAKISLYEASKMASAVPAAQIGESHRRGVIDDGMIADLVALDSDTGAIEAVFIGGELAYRR
jgi:N-acetylglucosamine-6-phosphate deacetylase